MRVTPEYGDNIFELGAVTANTLKAAGWDRTKIDAVWKEINAAQSYDQAVAVCRRYITVRGES